MSPSKFTGMHLPAVESCASSAKGETKLHQPHGKLRMGVLHQPKGRQIRWKPNGHLRNGCASSAKGETKSHVLKTATHATTWAAQQWLCLISQRGASHSINRELHTHSHHSQFTSAITHTHIQIPNPPQREKRASCKGGRAWSCPGNYIAAN